MSSRSDKTIGPQADVDRPRDLFICLSLDERSRSCRVFGPKRVRCGKHRKATRIHGGAQLSTGWVPQFGGRGENRFVCVFFAPIAQRSRFLLTHPHLNCWEAKPLLVASERASERTFKTIRAECDDKKPERNISPLSGSDKSGQDGGHGFR